MKKIYDISVLLDENFPIWPGDPAFELTSIAEIGSDSDANVSKLSMCVHTGTHVDAPMHFVNDGKSVEYLDLDVLIGPALVIEVPESECSITSTFLTALNFKKWPERILFKTANAKFWHEEPLVFHENFVALEPEGARLLVENGVRLVGIDYFSIASYWDAVPTHKILLESGVIVLETINLNAVEAGDYELICLPLNLAGSDGAPARCVLIQE